MAIAFVQAANNSTVGTATTVTITTTTGNLLVLAVYEGVNATSTISVSDTAGNTWTQVNSYVTSSGDRFAMLYSLGASSITSVTATWSGNISATVPVVVIEFSGVATGTPLDSNAGNPATSSGTTNSTTLTSGALTTSNAVDVLIFGLGIGSTTTGMTAGTNFTLNANATTSNQRCSITYRIVAATQSGATTSDTWNTGSSNRTSIFAAFANVNQSSNPAFEDDSFNASTSFPLIQQAEPIISVF